MPSKSLTVSSLDVLVTRGLKFGTIYADPPWQYENSSTRGAADDHYGTMSLDDLAALPVKGLALENAHLHLWTTNAFLPHSFKIIEAWGFTYKGCYLWVKPQIGMGNYWRVSHEILLLGTRGSATFKDKTRSSWGCFKRGKHSAKPDQIRHIIEAVSPEPRLEMFGRRCSPGWTVFGNEIERTMFDSNAVSIG